MAVANAPHRAQFRAIPPRAQRPNLAQQPRVDHFLTALLDPLGNDLSTRIDGKVKGAESLLSKRVIVSDIRGAPARLVDDLQGSNRAPGIVGMDPLRGRRVELGQSPV